ncbi:hypothetical protein [Aestuariibaculum sediminum]|nr:hypothetical protein [Aestuariibaculum sediminum]
MERIRLTFTVPGKHVRPLLISFTADNSATDDYDYGYEALNRNSFPYDMSWLVNGLKCTTQGVGSFDDTKKYPLWLYMSKEDDFVISLTATENFETPIEVYIYDAVKNTYSKLNDSDYNSHIGKGEYFDRYYLAFKNDNATSSDTAAKTLSTEDDILKNTKIRYLRNSKELYIDTNGLSTIKEIALINASGQRLFTTKNINNSSLKTPIYQLNNQLVFVNVITDLGQTTKQLIVN